MKQLVPILLSIIIVSCQQSEPEQQQPDPSLVGTRWATYYYRGIFDKDVYDVFYFRSSTQVERYSSYEKTSIVGEIDTYPYRYEPPAVSITIDGQVYSGTVNETFIRLMDEDYEAF